MEKSQPSDATVTPPATPPISPQPAPVRRSRRRRMLVVASVAAFVVGAGALARYASAPRENATEDDRLKQSEQLATVAPNAEPAVMTVASAAAPAFKARPTKPAKLTPTRNRAAASANATAKSTAPIVPTAIDEVPVRGDAAATNLGAASVSIASAEPAPVTLTGCLEIKEDTYEFRLTDIDGLDAPKSRSWRTGFLKKRPAPVALVEPRDPHGLQRQVGKRVAATGHLTDRELKVSSVQVVGPSCD